MKILWHCRGCNAAGETNVSLEDIMKKRDTENVLDIIIDHFIDHQCSKKDIGIRTT